jgi:hypothetical protein
MSLIQKKIDYRVRRDFGQVMNASFMFIRQNFRYLIRHLLFIVGPFALLGTILVTLLWISLERGLNMGIDVAGMFGGFFTAFLLYFVAFMTAIVMMIGVVYEYVALYPSAGIGEIETRQLWQGALRNFWRNLFILIGATFITSCLSFGLATVLTIVGGMLSAVIAPLFQMGVVGGFIGGVLVIVTVISSTVILATVFFMVTFISMFERTNVFNAVGRFFNILGKKWWQTFALQFISILIAYSLYFLIYIPILIFRMYQLFELHPSMKVLTIVSIFIFGILFVLVALFSFSINLIVTSFQYFTLVENKEFIGLSQAIQNMGTEVEEDELIEDEEYY